MNEVVDDTIDENMNIEIDDSSIQKPSFYDSKIKELDQRYNLIMNELSKEKLVVIFRYF